MRDPVQNESVLEPGALVLSDCDICCIDEFDKMSGSAQSILHEAMEQQTVSIAKAGVICSLSARTTILASANPQDSRYNPKLSIVDNINLPPTLLSRFDLIYVILDTPHPQNDERLAEHLLSLFMNEDDRETFRQDNIEKIEETIGMLPKFTNTMGLDLTLPVNDSGQEFLPTANLMHYINYARSIIPVFSDEACFALEDCYLELRGVSSTNGNGTDLSNNGLLQSATGTSSHHTTISATPRQLQSLIRLAEALARAHLRDEVTKDDVKEATRLIRTATLASAIDPTTGRIDMNTITSGISSNDRNVFSSVLTIVEQILAENIRITNFDYHQLMNLVREHSPNVQTDIFNRVLNHLEATNRLEWRHSEGSIRIKQGVHIAHEESE
jgi:DNA replication licensing factor MCM4